MAQIDLFDCTTHGNEPPGMDLSILEEVSTAVALLKDTKADAQDVLDLKVCRNSDLLGITVGSEHRMSPSHYVVGCNRLPIFCP
jgi:hypothetical protein